MNPLSACLIVAAFLFCVGLAGALSRSSAILVLAGIELMLGAANLNFIAFWRYGALAAPGLIVSRRRAAGPARRAGRRPAARRSRPLARSAASAKDRR